jgi:hypothetical protein
MSNIRGSLPEIIRNDKNVYEGDLRYYFQILWEYAKNLNHPYHNFRHILHVTYAVYRMCEHYVGLGLITPLQARFALIAALFHDFDHTGKPGPDSVNTARAIAGLHRHVLDEDRPYLGKMDGMIRDMEFPHQLPSASLSLLHRMLRDADMVQALDPVWLQEVVFGLAKERDVPPFEVLRQQVDFLQKLEFHTGWAQKHYPRSMIENKIAEAQALIDILQNSPVPIPA